MYQTDPRHAQLIDLMLYGPPGDDLGRNAQKPAPLAFDRINEGRPFSSDSFLSRLPVELTWQIIQAVPSSDLSSLALVNRDCRQLARSRQFASVTFDYSNEALSLLKFLLEEAKVGVPHPGTIRSPPLGVCIRQIIVSRSPGCIAWRHRVEARAEDQNINPRERIRRLNDACRGFFDQYMPDLVQLISQSHVLSHLETLDWRDTIQPGQGVLKAILLSGAQNIKIGFFEFNEGFELDVLPSEGQQPIKSLYLRLYGRYFPKYQDGIATTVSNILRLAAPTLESLALSDLPPALQENVPLSDITGNQLSFPKLRDLKLYWHTEYDPAWLSKFIQPGEQSPLRCLDINTDKYPSTTEFFQTCGKLPRLETFIWNCETTQPNLAFLEKNSHIRKFLTSRRLSSSLIDNQILPLLSESFRNLTSLGLCWRGASVSREALDRISTLTSLEQLYLKAGSAYAFDHEWLIDHGMLRDSLRSLKRLRRLALQGDTYPVVNDCDTVNPTQYYTLKRPRNYRLLLQGGYAQYGSQGLTLDDVLEQEWEEQHRQDMLGIADQYGREWPALEWLHCGDLPIGIDAGKDGNRKSVLLADARSTCSLLLQRMFGRGNEVSTF